ncbi:hypothetical protein ABPG74_005410 [Tetrahymena malaccensis]
MNILIGPIIGKVTDTTARILLEYDQAGEVTINLTSLNGEVKQEMKKHFEARKSSVFHFNNLEPNTKYVVKISPYTKDYTCSFKTLDFSSKNLKICWISCNDGRKNESYKDLNLWINLQKEVQEGKYDLICHIGDQIYLDSDEWLGNTNNTYHKLNEEIFKKVPQSQWVNYYEQIKEAIKDEYRFVWNYPATAKVLASVSNIMIYDDHDIRDNWGFLPQDYDPNSSDYYYGSICQQVYYEYQRQLRDETLDLSNTQNIKEEYFTIKLDKIGLFFADLRGDRAWHRTQQFDSTKVMQENQWQKLDNALNQEFKDVENFIFVSQSTVVFLNHTINHLIAKKIKDSQEQWVENLDEQYKLLKKLYDWKFQNTNLNREVTIICGDIHFGGHTDIYFQNKPAFKQFTSSSITNGVKDKFKRVLSYVGATVSEDLKGGFHFCNHGWTGNNNYGWTLITNKTKQNNQLQNYVSSQQVFARDQGDDERGIVLGKQIDNLSFSPSKSETNSCCQIF